MSSDMSTKQSVTDGEVWEKAYRLNNYEIEYIEPDESQETTKTCAIYFSSSGIYHPNTEEQLKKRIIEEDYYEWKHHRIKRASKHIFVRDVSKNFYVIGINERLSSVDKVVDFLRREVEGYEVVTIGSSGGAYMAVLAGVLLKAKVVYAFSCFWSLNAINYDVWHLVGKYKDDSERNKYYDLYKCVNQTETQIVYVYPTLNKDDVNNDLIQCDFVKDKNNVCIIGVKTPEHGVCMNVNMLDEFINIPVESVVKLAILAPVSRYRLAMYLLNGQQLFETAFNLVRGKIAGMKRTNER